MSNDVPTELKYTKSHEWVRLDDDGIATIGITDHAQELLGDLVFVELPEVGTELGAGVECAVVESVKAASDVYSPVAGEVIEVNEKLSGTPELTNKSPFDEGWLFRLHPNKAEDVDGLMDIEAYTALIDAEDH